MTIIRTHLLEAAKRRAIYAGFEARLLKVPVAEVQKEIRRMKREKLIYTDGQTRGWFGSGYAAYRAV